MAKTTPKTTTPAVVSTLQPIAIKAVNGHGWVTSQQVAQYFGKRHDAVLRDIREICSADEGGLHSTVESDQCIEDFAGLNFRLSEYKNEQGKPQPMVEMTKDGFTFLAMGFRGSVAKAWKIRFIAAFNQLEQAYIEHLEQKAETALQVRQTREMLLTVPWSEQLKNRYEGLRLLDQIKAEPDVHRRQHHYITLQRFNAMQGDDTPPLNELAPPTLFLENGPTQAELLEKVEDLERLRDVLVSALRSLTSMAMERLVFEGSEDLPAPLRGAVQAIKIAHHQKGGAQ